MPLVFLPETEALFWWGPAPLPDELRSAWAAGKAARARLITPEGVSDVEGVALGVVESVAPLSLLESARLAELPASVGGWALASKLALSLVARERVVPTLQRRGPGLAARWAAALSASKDAEDALAIAASLPAAAHAVALGEAQVWAPDALLRAFLDAAVDGLVRGSRGGPELAAPSGKGRSVRASSEARQADAATPGAWGVRFQRALSGEQAEFTASGFAERSVASDLERWSRPALGAHGSLRACFRLELPEREQAPFVLRFLLQSPSDASLLVSASELWNGESRSQLLRSFPRPEEALLEALGRAARAFAPLQRALEVARPETVELDPAEAWSFLSEGAETLAEAGFAVIVPGELTRRGQRRLRLRARVGGAKSKVAGVVKGAAALGMDELLTVDWQAVIGDQTLSLRELSALAKQKAPLVRYRGAWVALDPRELSDIAARVAAGPTQMPVADALKAALTGEVEAGSLEATVTATGGFETVLERLASAAREPAPAPSALQATLRPYQARGLAWLSTMSALGLGACLADDMGLGKTVQLISYLLARREQRGAGQPPALLVAPTSVLGNWERELARFAPSLTLVAHYGAGRRADSEFPRDALVLTSYGLLRRDAARLASAEWSVLALDEAQNIKNSASATARAARSLRAQQRFALTGTPVENRLAELWSIFELLNPGLLGPLETFRKQFAAPIERFADEQAATRLRKLVSPFILRRLKSDPNITPDLPAKNEMTVYCTLTSEQATLYKAVVDEELRRIAEAEGIERRGRVLALLTFAKQICNHPAQYLSDHGRLEGRSGKLSRITAMLEEALAAGDKALVFTQYREMGERLEAHFHAKLGAKTQFLHGGTPKQMRDEMVRAFQDDPQGPRIFVLSVKAGGTGLNLTAASHVFHYDRWWNPAVEDQATDRAYRIGQKRAVQVHKLVCTGTVEERIAALLEQKRKLSQVVGGGEQWITELGTSELRELFALSKSAVVANEDEKESA
ncbi:MAG TPA: DEAD/DEAH box helicase [Polyangiaceae bacterium]|nr:DEAD/DEAH box helicase [Polyangiaceae bacterium]